MRLGGSQWWSGRGGEETFPTPARTWTPYHPAHSP